MLHPIRSTSAPSRSEPPALRAAIGASTLLAVVCLAAAACVVDPARSQDLPTQGELRVIAEEGELQAFPLEHTKVDARIDGNLSLVTVTQTFANPYDDVIEAIYVFPLPDNAAVNEMLMKVGDRTIRGEIKRREEARRIYEEAKQAGHVAGLLDQERPNIFTQSVANILPGNSIEIMISYAETLPLEEGGYAFVFPMVVGPRFIPGSPRTSSADLVAGPTDVEPPPRKQQSGTGWAPDTDIVPDASRITPPVLKPGERSGHDIEVSLAVAGGMPIRDLRSPSHAIDIAWQDDRAATVTLKPFDTIPNKDLVVEYRLAGEGPELGVLSHRNEQGGGFFTALLAPADRPRSTDIAPKEMIFVVDCSGSMSGEPMAKAKQAMRHAIKNLDPRDSFQIIRFSENASGFRPRPVPATPENIREGLHYIDQLSGQGGTMMIEGIRAALGFPFDDQRLRIVSFMTDGYIGNETQILDEIQQKLGSARLFSFGVGNSVNRYLLDRMAAVGRGAVEYVLLGADTQEVVERFYDRVRNPYLTDLAIDWGDLEVEDVYPSRVPDLFLGQSLTVSGRYASPGRGNVTVRGKLGGRPWQKTYAVELPAQPDGSRAIGSVWARARIRDLNSEMYGGEKPEVVEQITELALAHQLMTRYTSFVAVEERIEVVGGEPRTVTVPVEMPEGVSYEGVFGEDRMSSVMPMGARASMKAAGYGSALRAAPAEVHVRSAEPEAGAKDQGRIRTGQVEAPASEPKGARPLAVTLRAMATRVTAGQTLEITLEVQNRSSRSVSVPTLLRLGHEVELRVIDGRWRQIDLRTPPEDVTDAAKRGGTRTLAPGERVTLTLRIPVAATAPARASGPMPSLPGPGAYHLAVLRLGGVEVASNRIHVTITP